MSDLHQRLAWEDLIEYVELGQVVPILGDELLRFDIDGRPVALDTFLASRLAARLRIDPQRLPGPAPGISDVIVQYVRHHGGAREEVDQRLNTILREADLPIPAPLLRLAAIRQFRLFVSLTFDPFMARALDAVRHGGERRTQELAFSINDGQDLPAPKAELRAPVVYHLLGRLSPTPSCALTEEDTLEFLQGLQSPARRPNLLLDELKTNHLLLIGCRFSDWLGRLLLRIAKSRRLSEKRTMEVLVWSAAPDDALVRFLADFSSRTKFAFSGAAAFVDELADRMAARPAAALPAEEADPARDDAAG
ncbi:SIR2 family protein, partial [Acidisphaera rubrifaciens]|uniref:SIR2 family protein n=1 Tax=Acidisphaera rubrifaciens TaxID=50715 RepID=UPI0006621454